MRKYVAVMVVLIMVASIVALKQDVKFFTVSGTSMVPVLENRDLIVVLQKDVSKIKVGDIITYRKEIEGEEYIFTHRVVEIVENGFITKGDSLRNPDNYVVGFDDVVGVYTLKIPKAGLLGDFARTFWGYLLLILIPGTILIMIELKNILEELK
jgi:signal peptidase